MYEQHPVPQQISSYSFKLVGNMTLRQFFQVAGGAIIALIIYALPLPVIVKWPLIILSAISGAAFAFLPIQNRPLEQWLAAFFRSIYSPTIYVWDENASNFNYFKQDQSMSTLTPMQQKIQQQQIEQEAEKNKKAQSNDPDFIKNLDQGEEAKLKQISNIMQGKAVIPVQQQTKESAANSDQYVPKGEMIGQYQGQIVSDSNENQKHAAQPDKQHKKLEVPEQQKVSTEHEGFQPPQQIAPTRQIIEKQVGEVFTSQQNSAVGQTEAQFSTSASPPMRPEIANTIVGQVLDSQMNIIEGAILEVKDKQGIPVRAMKSNKAGHFMMVTALANGEYTVYTEKEGFTFQPVSITMTGKIIEPIIIKSQ